MKRYMKLMPNYQCVVKHELKYNPWKFLVESVYNSRYPVCTTRDIQCDQFVDTIFHDLLSTICKLIYSFINSIGIYFMVLGTWRQGCKYFIVSDGYTITIISDERQFLAPGYTLCVNIYL